MYRSHKNARLGGVCGAFAEKFGLKVNVVRLIYLIGTIMTGFYPGIFLYLALCLIIPKRDEFSESKILNNVKNLPNVKANETNVNKLKGIVEEIKRISSSILGKQKANPLVANLITEFKEEIMEFEKYSPQLEKQYIECINYLKQNNVEKIQQSIIDLKLKISSSSDAVKVNYVSILEQQEKRMKLIEEIKEYTEIIESKLVLVLNTLQNIEASIMHAELQTQIGDSNYDGLQSQISILTESITEMSDIFQKNKINIKAW